jgi:hypothetical protein
MNDPAWFSEVFPFDLAHAEPLAGSLTAVVYPTLDDTPSRRLP